MNTNFQFVAKRKIWYAISLIIIIAGLVSLFTRGLNLGIDFTGGNLFQLQFSQDVSSDDLRQAVSAALSTTPSIQKSDENVYLVRTETLTEEQSQTLLDSLTTKFGEMKILRNELVGPIVGQELISNARWALVLALILMLIYITIRFKFLFAVSALVPLMHDALVMVGLISILQVEVDSAFVAAILTILGYSVNATIVIFDRVRENLHLLRTKEEFSVTVNHSINQTLGRSINTVVAVLLLVICLYLFGGETTKSFTLSLLIGIVAGGYSSVFIAGPLLADLSNHFGPDQTKNKNNSKQAVAAKGSKKAPQTASKVKN